MDIKLVARKGKLVRVSLLEFLLYLWKKFQIVKIQDDEYGIRCVENGKYVQANLDDGGKLVATSDSVSGVWEAFKITKL